MKLSLAWITAFLRSGNWQEVLITGIIILSALLASRIYLFIIDKLITRIARRTASTLDDHLLQAVRNPGAILIALLGIYGAIHRYQFRFQVVLDSVLFILAVLTFLYAIISLISVALEWYGDKISREREGETVARELLPLADKIMRIVIAGIGLMVILDRYNISVHSILVTLGIGSLAVGLALQDTLANMFGGFTIMLDRPFRIGDRIQLQSGEQGDVRYIGMRTTSIAMMDGNLLVIPNSYLVRNILINHSFPDSRSRLALEVSVTPDADQEQVKIILLEAAKANSRILQNPEPVAYFKAFNPTALIISLTCYLRSYTDSVAVTDEVNTQITAKLKQAGIKMPLPASTIYIIEDSKQPQIPQN
jgi:small-conductance mechanosensitive channel